FLRAVQLGVREAMFARALRLDRDGGQAVRDLAVLYVDAERHGLHGRTQVAAVHAGAQEFRIRTARELVEAIVEHLRAEALHEIAAIVGDARLFLPRALADDGHRRARDF